MFSYPTKFFVLASILIYAAEYGVSTGLNINSADWAYYKTRFNKQYATAADESTALYYYSYNMNLVANHNFYYAKGLRTYGLAASQFSDMRIIQFNALFPQTTQPTVSNGVVPPPTVQEPPTTYNLFEQGYSIIVEDQGRACNDGWAYATAKSIEIMQATQAGNAAPARLSAQNLIDCAGGSTGCTRQVPQTGFDFLTVYNQPLHLLSSYPNNIGESLQGMCIPTGTQTTTLSRYSTITNGADATMRRYVGAGYPVVIEFNPTSFEFMHYSEGVFQQPSTSTGSHFMPVIGYGHDTVWNLDYWIVQNSFGDMWGENGLIRIVRSASKPLTKSAVFPWP